MNREELARLPKVELHCHLDGSLSPGFIRRRLGREVADSELMVSPDCRNLAEYLEKFALPLQCIQDAEGLREAGYDFLKTVSRENVRYAEVRFAPLFSVREGFGTRQVLEALLEGLERGRKETGTKYNVIVCAMRGHTEEESLAMLREAREFLGRGVCAADLAGDEAAYPMKLYMHLFQEAGKLGFPFTIHAGECGNPRNIADALEAGASRIGHGIAMGGALEIQELCKKRGAGIEVCPISNLQTRALPEGKPYPLKEFLDNGLLVSVNTDNRTVSGSSLVAELEFIQKEYRITDEEIIRMQENAVRTSFAGEELKQRLLRELQETV